jgi:hypothetical protein
VADRGSVPWTATDADLQPVLAALLAREPLFHHRELVDSREAFERETAEDFWEVTASGRRVDRDEVWAVLERRLAEADVDQAVAEGWETTDAAVRRIAPDTYLLTYTLSGQAGRVTRRLTVWQGSTATGWRARYHQGTVVTGAP